MQVFIFHSEKDSDVAGFTAQRDGSNLPAEFAPWKPLGGSVMQVGDNIVGVTDNANAVLDGIKRDGFYLGRSEVRITRIGPHGH
jgi:hypothetical protein